MPRQNAAPAVVSTPALIALRDAWFFVTIAGGALLLAIPLLLWVKGEITQDDPIAVGGVMLGSGAVACFLYAALKFGRALRLGLRERTVVPLLFTAALGLAGMALLLGNHFRGTAVKAGTLGLLLAVVLTCVCLLPFKKFLQQRIRIAIGLLVLGVLPLSLFLAAIIEIGFYLHGTVHGFAAPPTFPDYIPLFARRTVADCAGLFFKDVHNFSVGTFWLPLEDLKVMATDPKIRDVDTVWWGLSSRAPHEAVALALTVPVASPRTIPTTMYDSPAGMCIGRFGTEEQIHARLQGQYSDTHILGICYGLYNSTRQVQFGADLAALLERGGSSNPRMLWHMLEQDRPVRDELLRKHLVSDTAASKVLIASARDAYLTNIGDEALELALKSSDANARLMVLNSANAHKVGPDGKLKAQHNFKKSHWSLIVAIASGERASVSAIERIQAARLLQYLTINTQEFRRWMNAQGGLPAEAETALATITKDARDAIEQLKE